MPTPPQRVQRTREAGQPGMPPGAKYVGRGTKWGNPWRVVRHAEGTYGVIGEDLQDWTTHDTDEEAREHAVARYRAYRAANAELTAALPELRGLDLACWCKIPDPGQPDRCHAVPLIEDANPTEEPTR